LLCYDEHRKKNNKEELMKVKFNLVSLVAIVVAFTIGAFSFASISNSAQAKSPTKIELWVNKPQARINGAMKWIDESNKNVTPIIQWSRTMLPLRFIAENMGFSVDWDAKESKATVSDSGELVWYPYRSWLYFRPAPG
jgi:hypothetical protein